ncbi:MAG: glycosyltransferase family 2 protein [Vicingaceae bacterium]
MDEKPSFSFIIPIHNEVEVFNQLIDRLMMLDSKIEGICEFILIDDGSTDGSDQLIENVSLNNPLFKAIFLTRNFGHQKALSAGLDNVEGEYIMMVDADLQDPPEMFFEFYAKMKEGYDVVYGIRKKRKEGFLKRLAYKGYYQLLNRISNFKMPKDAGDFAMFNAAVARAINRNREEGRYLRGLRSWVGFKQMGIPYERDKRAAGEPSYTLKKLLTLALDGIMNFTTLPIKLLTAMGLSCIFLSIIYLFITLLRKYLYGDVPSGFTALLFMIILFGGFQLFSLGIIGEYIQRIFFQVKKRPLYLIKKTIKNSKIYYE